MPRRQAWPPPQLQLPAARRKQPTCGVTTETCAHSTASRTPKSSCPPSGFWWGWHPEIVPSMASDLPLPPAATGTRHVHMPGPTTQHVSHKATITTATATAITRPGTARKFPVSEQATTGLARELPQGIHVPPPESRSKTAQCAGARPVLSRRDEHDEHGDGSSKRGNATGRS